MALARREFPRAHISGGFSNVSFGMPNRRLLNLVFTRLCAEAGADSAILDPVSLPVAAIAGLDADSEPARLAKALLTGADESGPARQAAVNDAKALIENVSFRVFIVFYLLAVVAQSFTPLLIGYGKDLLGMTAADTGKFTTACFVGTLVIGISMPLPADRFGFRLIGTLGAALAAAGFLVPILIPGHRAALLGAYALLSGSVNLTTLVLANLGAELVPDVKPAMIIAVASILIMPVTLSVAPLAGRLVDAHGAGGYLAVLVLGTGLSLCSLLGFVFVIREPRTGQELFIRMRGV